MAGKASGVGAGLGAFSSTPYQSQFGLEECDFFIPPSMNSDAMDLSDECLPDASAFETDYKMRDDHKGYQSDEEIPKERSSRPSSSQGDQSATPSPIKKVKEVIKNRFDVDLTPESNKKVSRGMELLASYSPQKKSKYSRAFRQTLFDEVGISPEKMSYDDHAKWWNHVHDVGGNWGVRLFASISKDHPPMINVRHIFEGDKGKGKHYFKEGDKDKITRAIESSQNGVIAFYWREKEGAKEKYSTSFPSKIMSFEDVMKSIQTAKIVSEFNNTKLLRTQEGLLLEAYYIYGQVNSAFPVFCYHVFDPKTLSYQITKSTAITSTQIIELISSLKPAQKDLVKYQLKNGDYVIDIAPLIADRTGIKCGIFIQISSDLCEVLENFSEKFEVLREEDSDF